MSTTICFDLRCLQIGHESRGIGMHARSIVEHLRPEEDKEYVFYVFDDYDPIQKLGIKLRVPYKLIQTPRVKKSIDRPQDFYYLSKIIWHKFKPLRHQRVDVFVQFDFMLGLPAIPGTKTILIAYDVIPLIFAADYLPTPAFAFRSHKGPQKIKKAIRAAYYRFRFRLHYKNFEKADRLVSISEATSRDIVAYLGVDPKKITTIPLAPVFNETKAVRPKLLPKDLKKFIFYIGATDSRKRVEDLIAAFNIVRGRGENIRLVLAGKEFDPKGEVPSAVIRTAILDSAYREDIVQIGYVGDAEKTWLYDNALCFVFPTLYEGFGLPVVEASLRKCYTVCYDNSSIPEVASSYTRLVRTGDYVELAHEILNIPKDRQAISRSQSSAQATYDWNGYLNRFFPVILERK